MSDEVVWMTYETLAERLGIEKESARQRARRGMWARRKDNAGRLTVAVPVELLEAPETLHDARQEPLPDDEGALHEADENRYLNRYVEKIEQALEAAQQKVVVIERERDEARTEAAAAEKARAVTEAQIEALNAILAVERERVADERRQAEERVAVERQRVAEWQAVADRFASQAERLTEAAEARRGWWLWKRRA